MATLISHNPNRNQNVILGKVKILFSYAGSNNLHRLFTQIYWKTCGEQDGNTGKSSFFIHPKVVIVNCIAYYVLKCVS